MLRNSFKRKNFEGYSNVNEKNRVHTIYICVEPPSSDLDGPLFVKL